MKNWWIYTGQIEPHDGIERLPEPPDWRKFNGTVVGAEVQKRSYNDTQTRRRFGEDVHGAIFQSSIEEIELINTSLYLRRPLLVTGKPGTGKSSLPYAVAHELKLGSVLRWPITTRTTLSDGLYHYDAIGRLQDASLQKNAAINIGKYIRLGPLGTALLPTKKPRVLLIDEIDKSDIDLPNDLLNIFEEGEFDIPELSRLADEIGQVLVMPYDGQDSTDRVPIENGKVYCAAFPFIVLTSNGERDFPPAFLRRCLRLDMQLPDKQKLKNIVAAHLNSEVLDVAEPLIQNFLARRDKGDLATDQLLNAIYLASRGIDLRDRDIVLEALLRHLSSIEGL